MKKKYIIILSSAEFAQKVVEFVQKAVKVRHWAKSIEPESGILSGSTLFATPKGVFS